MIGEAQDTLGRAATAEEGAKEPHEEQPGQELEQLEKENEHRVEALKGKPESVWISLIILSVWWDLTRNVITGNETLYQDLGLDAQKYTSLPTTWKT